LNLWLQLVIGLMAETQEPHLPSMAKFIAKKITTIALSSWVMLRSSARKLIFLVAYFVLGARHGLPSPQDTAPRSSPYVPLDSWVYPALRRLAALGYITGQVTDTAPWTRAECRRQTDEAASHETFNLTYFVQRDSDQDVHSLIADLEAEFPAEEPTTELRLATIYTRLLGIGGTPLHESYHFGQTLVNDDGRPYGSGLSNDTGFSAYGTASRFSFYVRAEAQAAPGRSAYSSAVQQFIAGADENPISSSAIAKTNNFQTLEMYAGVQLGPENITFGKQSLWWGPGEDSAFAFSNNAAPIWMFRFDQTKPLILPGPLRYLGKIHTQFVFGELSGHSWPPHPYMNAQKVTFDLTDDFELGFTRSTFFGGVGHPLTWHSFLESMFSVTSPNGAGRGAPTPTALDPGDRHSGFDFRWHLPGLRRRVTLYSDSYSDDEPSPIDAPRRSAWGPGIYFTQLPKLKHLDLRVESYSTWLFRKDYGGLFIYWNDAYHDAYTNDGNIIGSWVGRDGRALVATSRYWLSGNTFVEGQYKQIKTGSQFLPGGGTQTDFSINGQVAYKQQWIFGVWLQAERYDIPLLGSPQYDVAAWLQVTFAPRDWAIHRK
jgi:hypothetical protein